MKNFTKAKSYKNIIMMLIVVILLQACSAQPVVQPQEQSNQDTLSLITVTDYLGREVLIDKPVERIACGYAYSGHVVTMLGRAEDIVAVVNGLQRDKVLTNQYPHIKDLPVPFSSGTINIEELLTTKPDVVFIQPDTATNESVVSKLDQLGIPYIAIAFNSIKEQIDSISLIGKVIEEKKRPMII